MFFLLILSLISSLTVAKLNCGPLTKWYLTWPYMPWMLDSLTLNFINVYLSTQTYFFYTLNSVQIIYWGDKFHKILDKTNSDFLTNLTEKNVQPPCIFWFIKSNKTLSIDGSRQSSEAKVNIKSKEGGIQWQPFCGLS